MSNINAYIDDLTEKIDRLVECGYTRSEAIQVINMSFKLRKVCPKKYISSNERSVDIMSYFDNEADKSLWQYVRCSDIIQQLDLDTNIQSLGRELINMGFKNEKISVNGVQGRYYLLPPYKQKIEHEKAHSSCN